MRSRSHIKSIVLSSLILLGIAGTGYAADKWNAVITNKTANELRVNFNGAEQNISPGTEMHANNLEKGASFNIQVGKQAGQPNFAYTSTFRFTVESAVPGGLAPLIKLSLPQSATASVGSPVTTKAGSGDGLALSSYVENKSSFDQTYMQGYSEYTIRFDVIASPG